LSEPERRIEVGLIGYGLAGRVFHAPVIQHVPRLHLAAVATSRIDGLEGLAPDVRRVATPEAIIADPAIELVVIASPNQTHFPLADAALRAGKHVVVDKPFMISCDDADAVIFLANRSGLLLSAFHNRRWDGDFLTVRNIVESKKLGALVHFEARWDRFRPQVPAGWRHAPGPGAGLLSDLGPHLIDQVIELLGPAEWISADLAQQRDGALVDDYFEIILHYGEMRAIVGASSIAAAPRPRFLVQGFEASFVKHGLDPQERQLASGMAPADPAYGEDQPDSYGTLTSAEGTSQRIPTERGRYDLFYEGVADAIRNGAPAPVEAADARLGLAVIELARVSAREGRRLPFPA
jgi:scyllo-inositol 2-dehydrogenase (NADP+)